jgi:RNA polymerase sigma-70 factor (ECF subfamily)
MNQNIDDIILNYSATLYKICLGYSNTIEDAKDLLQEVFINVWKGLDSFNRESDIKTWLYRIAVNTCLMKLRKKSIKTISINNIDFDWIAYYPFENNESDSFELLHKLVQDLPNKDKSIILLYLEGLTHQEIATIIGITSNYVSVKISRIKKMFSNKIKNNG